MGWHQTDSPTWRSSFVNWAPLLDCNAPSEPYPFRTFCSARRFLRKSPAWRGVCVCVWNIWTDVKLLIVLTAGGRSVMVSLLPTKTLTIDGDTRLGQSGVPALLWSPVVQGLLRIYFILQSLLVNGIRLSLQPDTRFFCTAFAIWCLFLYWLFGWLSTHFSPFQNAELRMNNFDLGLILPFTLSSWEFWWLLRRGLFSI